VTDTVLSPRDIANRDQRAASDPAVSAFVAASAGSGKTKLLTDRLLRLMLNGAKPERIQCLTFTKAAAAEMALRLHGILGQWVLMDDAVLTASLDERGIKATPPVLERARALFAEVLDLPGGMRIGTIHAFCQSLLRRFPLESALSPHFRLLEGPDADEALTAAREDMLAAPETEAKGAELELLAEQVSLAGFADLTAELDTDRDRLARALALGADLPGAIRRALGLAHGDADSVIAAAVTWKDEPALRDAARLATGGSPAVAARAAQILEWLSIPFEERPEHWESWRSLFLRDDGKTRGGTVFVNTKLAAAHPDLLAVFLAEAARIQSVDDAFRAIKVAGLSAALVTLAVPVLANYAGRKDQAGFVDYDDLIGRSAALLADPGAAWVLYKLDGGLDHLLLDEVQDTAPLQWKIAHALTQEFFAGAGTRDTIRTAFAVGDRKQSIFSFQGADADSFDRERATLAGRVQDAGQAWCDVGLTVSFRSTETVLQVVDSVFSQPDAAAGVVPPGETLVHQANRLNHPGVVELWPLAPRPATEAPPPWTVPDRNQSVMSAETRLAEALADWIRDQIGTVIRSARRAEGEREPERVLTAGDVMVLVRRRTAFSHALVRGLKTRGVPVAGMDRLTLTTQPAVQDLLTLADALLLPGDDLAFACLLTSPLGGLDDDDLMALAIGRQGALWETLRDRAGENPAWDRAWRFFATLLGRVDYVTPHALFAEALFALGGRARLFARLGAEAAELVDEVLNAALAFGRAHPPSLQGFVQWLRQSAAEVKREAGPAGGLVRVMTVHGAKGLQAPLVIVPDTTALPKGDDRIFWAEDPRTGVSVPLWVPRGDLRCEAVGRQREDAARRRMEEHNRLFYVALTRAEDRLLICGWQSARDAPALCWYNMAARGLENLAVTREPFGPWEGEVVRFASGSTIAVSAVAVEKQGSQVAEGAPAWLGTAPGWTASPPPAEPVRPLPLAPSRPEGVELGAVPAAASPLAERDGSGGRFHRGTLIHALLQHLPNLPPADRAAAALRYLDRPGFGLVPTDAHRMVDEVMGILDHPDLIPLFGPGSRAEVPLTGVIGDVVVGGLVDRLVILPDRIIIADFKTNRHPPARVEDVPVLYRRQMASYEAVLRAIFPGRPVSCALIWTRERRVMFLPPVVII